MKNSLPISFVVWSVMVSIFTPDALAAAGDLDASFGGTGMLQFGFGRSDDEARAVALQPDGKIIIAAKISSQPVLARFDTNGVLDHTFGSRGLIYPSQNFNFTTAKVQSDGKIVVAGSTDATIYYRSDFLLARFNADGSPDLSFGNEGFVTKDYHGNADGCRALLIQSDGKLLVAGASYTDSYPNYHLAMSRYDTNGLLDTTFNGTGSIYETNSSAADFLAQQRDGRLLVGGYIGTNNLFRFNLDGSLDTSFASSGKMKLTGFNQIGALAIQYGEGPNPPPDMILVAGGGYVNGQSGLLVARMSLSGVLDTTFNGTGIGVHPSTNLTAVTGLAGFANRFVRHAIVAGTAWIGGKKEFLLARFNSTSIDTAFGVAGVVNTSLSPGDDETCGMVIQSGRRVVLAGTSRMGAYNRDVALARYNWTDGSLDTNFHGTGMVVQNFADLEAGAKCVAVQSDGKIVVGGFCGVGSYSAASLCRLNPDGTFDPAFGDNGKVVTPVGEGNSVANAIAIQPDGKIVIAGTAYDGNDDSVMLARYHPHGALDTSFGTNGTLITITSSNGSVAVDLALQPDGKIVAGVSLWVADQDFAVFRYHADGSLDSTWNGTGKVITGVGSESDELHAVAVQSDGKIIASGGSYFPGAAKFGMVRYRSDGSLDSSFGTFGRVAAQAGSATLDLGYGMVLQPNGRIILGGLTTASSLPFDPDVALMRFTPTGGFDSSFDADGRTTTPIALGWDFAYRLALQTDGRIIAGCRTEIGSHYRFGVVRFLSAGAVDTAYGVSGVNYFDFGTSADETLNDMALDANNRVVMVGDVGGLFGILRVQGDPVLRLNSITCLPNGHTLIRGEGVPNAAHTLRKSSTLAAGTFSPLSPITPDASGNWQYEEPASSGNGFYRLSLP